MVESKWSHHFWRDAYPDTESLGAFRPRGDLRLENLALRHQLSGADSKCQEAQIQQFGSAALDLHEKDLVLLEGGPLVILQSQAVVGWA
jgi:hypothetical protein